MQDVTGQWALTKGSSAIVELHVLHNKMILTADGDDGLFNLLLGAVSSWWVLLLLFNVRVRFSLMSSLSVTCWEIIIRKIIQFVEMEWWRSIDNLLMRCSMAGENWKWNTQPVISDNIKMMKTNQNQKPGYKRKCNEDHGVGAVDCWCLFFHFVLQKCHTKNIHTEYMPILTTYYMHTYTENACNTTI